MSPSDLYKTELIASYLPICIGLNLEQNETNSLDSEAPLLP